MPGGTVASSPRAAKKPAARPPADATAGLTGKAAQQALQDHIMKSGTSDVKKIDRLRRASLQADSAGPSAQSAQAANAAMMAAAMAEVDDEEEEEEDDEDASADGSVAVTFTEAGTLGLKFTPNKQTGNIELLAVNPGTQAERHPQLKAGLILRSVAGASVSGKSYQEVLGLIKAGGRPLEMSFVPGGTVASSPRAPQLRVPSNAVTATFSVAGPLGLRFKPNNASKTIELLSINPGSQAERGHANLQAGMTLYAVNDAAVSGKPYQDVLQLIKSTGRPLKLTFVPARSEAQTRPQQAPAPAPVAYVPTAPKQKPEAGIAGDVTVTFTKQGPLGVKFVSRGSNVIILSIGPGSQASEHRTLRPGLTVVSVSGRSIAGMTYEQVIALIRGASRPTQIAFTSQPAAGPAGGAVSNSPRLLNAVMEELTSWLDLRGAGQYAPGVQDAFQKGKYPPETWIAELADMDDEELAVFLDAVRRAELPGSARTVKGPNGGFRELPTGPDGRVMDQAEKDRRASHVDRFYQCQKRGRVRDLESGLRGLGLLQYAAGLRDRGVTNSTELATLFLKLGDEDVQSRSDLFVAHGIRDPEHQAQICEWIGLETRDLPPALTIVSPPASRDEAVGDSLSARTSSPPISVTFTEPGSLGIRLIPHGSNCVIKEIIDGTQAARCPQLVPNLVLTNVSGQPCAGLSYKQTLALLKAAARPVSLLFVQPGGTISPKTMNSTIQQQEEDEVRGSPSVQGKRRQSAEEVRAGQKEEEQELDKPIDIVVTFTEPGSLGITFGAGSDTPNGQATTPPYIKALRPGGMAAACGKLREKLFLVKVNSERVQSYSSAISAIKGAGRPLTLIFSTGALITPVLMSALSLYT